MEDETLALHGHKAIEQHLLRLLGRIVSNDHLQHRYALRIRIVIYVIRIGGCAQFKPGSGSGVRDRVQANVHGVLASSHYLQERCFGGVPRSRSPAGAVLSVVRVEYDGSGSG